MYVFRFLLALQLSRLFQLTSHIEATPYAFVAMSVLSTAVAVLVSWTGLRRYPVSVSTAGLPM